MVYVQQSDIPFGMFFGQTTDQTRYSRMRRCNAVVPSHALRVAGDQRPLQIFIRVAQMQQGLCQTEYRKHAFVLSLDNPLLAVLGAAAGDIGRHPQQMIERPVFEQLLHAPHAGVRR